MKNPFDLDVDNKNMEEEYIPQTGTHAYQSHDGERSLVQNERRRNDNPKDRFIGAIDQGTTSTRFIIFDCTGNPISKYQIEFRQLYEHPG